MSYPYYRKYRRNTFAAKKTEMISKFSSDCRGCGGKIVAGNKIVRNKENVWVCEKCVETTVKFQPSAPKYAIGARTQYRGRCEDAPACGCGCTDYSFAPPDYVESW